MEWVVTKFTKLKKTLAGFILRRKNYEQEVWNKLEAKVELLQYLALSINPSVLPLIVGVWLKPHKY